MAIDSISLQCFIASSETKSFTKAAQRVGRTQSAVSQQIAKLENILDKQLFKRGKVLELTNDGEAFLDYAKQILTLHNQAIDHFKEPDLKGEVRFGIPEDFASVFLYNFLAEFTRDHPNISFHIECDLTLNLYENFKKKKLDMVLLKMPCPRGKSGGVDFATHISSEKLCWVGNEKLVKKQKILPLVLSPEPCVYRASAIQALEKKKIKWKIGFSSHSYAGTIAAVRAGIGVTILPQKMVPSDLRIIKLDILPKLESTDISLLKLTDKNPAVNSFENFVLKHLQ